MLVFAHIAPAVRRAFCAAAVCLFLLAGGGIAVAQEMTVPVRSQYPLFLKILTFDRNLKSSATQEIVIGVVYQRKYRASLNAKDELLAAAADPALRSIDGVPVRIVPIDIDETPLPDALGKHSPRVLYIAPLRLTDIGAVTAVSRNKRLLTITGVPKYVEAGLSVGLDTKGERPVILVNLAGMRAEGSDFQAQFLKLAKVVQQSN